MIFWEMSSRTQMRMQDNSINKVLQNGAVVFNWEERYV